MTLNWNNIRPLGNSLNDGFEELVCQLAARETIADGKSFRRIGKPDGGKESYWELENGDLFMWQAKYFTTSLTPTQWTQIDESVKTAIRHHQNLVKYYVCLPIDFPDAKVKERKAALEKWKEKVQEWKKIASDKGMQINFEFWGSSELISRLSKRENEGLTYFWFNKEEFLDEWFDSKNEESILALGARYTPELNVELEISKLLDGLTYTAEIKTHADIIYKDVFGNYRAARSVFNNEEVKTTSKDLESYFDLIKKKYTALDFKETVPIDTDGLIDSINIVVSTLQEIVGKFYSLRDQEEKGDKVDYYNRAYTTEINNAHKLISSLKKLSGYFKSDILYLAKHPYLLLTGEAGIGKSHLLADMVRKRKEDGLTSLFLLGENFSTKEQPWTQILYNQLRKNSLDEFIFLEALNAKAESGQKRILIFIDALNEGEGRYIWKGKLKYFIRSFQKYQWLGLVISVRDSYEQLIAPEEEIDQDLILRREHYGFADYEYEATKRFFQYYGILQPASPILSPEFHNPLFLKLFCKSLQEKGLSQIPDGYDGITKIIEFYLDAVNHKLSLPDELDYDSNKKLIHKCVEKVVKKMNKSGKDFITYSEADKIIDTVFDGKCYRPQPFLKKLISEGVFNVDLRWTDSGKDYEVVYFGYQRFQDHLFVSFMLDNFLDSVSPHSSFKSGRLYELVKDEHTCAINRNLIEAMAVQIPERTGKELFEIAPHAKQYHAVALSWVNSLIWRKPENIGKAAVDYVNKIIFKDDNIFTGFLYTIISSAMKPNFKFNAESLHQFLKKQTLSERDHFWTIWLQDKYGADKNRNPVSRLIDWAWNDNDKNYVSREAMILGCVTMSWFLTSANRSLRDSATKALICLFESRPCIIIEVLQKFDDVNDPYITERLYAAAYGAVHRSNDFSNLERLIKFVYDDVFNKDTVYPHILLRDYARGIIEFAITKNIPFGGDVLKISPPYKSEKLPSEFPSNQEIDQKYKPKREAGDYGKGGWGSSAIIDSMTTEYGRGTGGYGDFGRYTFQSALYNFKVNASGLSNYAIQRIFELGYDPKLFTSFDSKQGNSRDGSYTERIGKKYQWIIFYELLARVSDQCFLTDRSGWGQDKKVSFEGPWYPYVRDIDPTFLIKETKAVQYDQIPFQWWFKEHYIHLDMPIKQWLSDTTDLPNGVDLICAVDDNNTQWLWLDSSPIWMEKEPLEEDRYNVPKKRLSFWVSAYIVRKKDKVNLLAGLKSNDEKDLPAVRSMYSIFSREYYGSKAFKCFGKPYYSGQNWIKVFDKKDEVCGEVQRTAEYFLWEEEFDQSKNEVVAYYKPSELIFNGLKLKFSKKEGELLNDLGELICFDPSVYNESFRGLLVRKDAMEAWLSEKKLALIWSVVGEKLILGNTKSITDNGRLTLAGYYELDKGLIKGQIKILKKE